MMVNRAHDTTAQGEKQNSYDVPAEALPVVHFMPVLRRKNSWTPMATGLLDTCYNRSKEKLGKISEIFSGYFSPDVV